ncbi:MAG TPA: Cof-type HAD-IIB family hydrolase [Candidatus Olsenella avicola]|uniref:HAD-IIB family hydrolase n=1 Tax=Olsenella sp. An285 TaxID=1965621 RepID=UPI000B39A342|nr:HAD family hydrolase [Olsenella sp. An285]OUO45115.1 hypothetical protein B5F79_10465 [Olsenella sp. An285]HIY51030.1 Cof-type HAD-IIB family hydrolase [Candidatus Olsenella avicola]
MAGVSGSGAATFFDVDGTLVWHDPDVMGSEGHDFSQDVPTPAVYEAFRRMRAAGHLTFICTGRPVPFLLDSLRDLRPDGYVAAAGAYVQVGDTVVRDVHIPDDLLLEAARRFEAAGIDVTFESNTQGVELRPSGAPRHLPGLALARTAKDVAERAAEHRFAKFCVSGCPLEGLAPVREFCEEHFTVADLQFGTYEFSLRGVDKGSGIGAALEHLGHGLAGTYAFGDSENDLPMARSVETFVAMGNALPAVRDRADYVTLSVERDGVPAALEHFGLI